MLKVNHIYLEEHCLLSKYGHYVYQCVEGMCCYQGRLWRRRSLWNVCTYQPDYGGHSETSVHINRTVEEQVTLKHLYISTRLWRSLWNVCTYKPDRGEGHSETSVHINQTGGHSETSVHINQTVEEQVTLKCLYISARPHGATFLTMRLHDNMYTYLLHGAESFLRS